jgi:hypothetical protein
MSIYEVLFFDKDIEEITFADKTLNLLWKSIKHSLDASVNGFCNKQGIDYKSLFIEQNGLSKGVANNSGQELLSNNENNKEKEKENGKDNENSNEVVVQGKIPFETFWNLYDKKVGSKTKLISKWDSLNEQTQLKVLRHVEQYKLAQSDKQYRKNPETYLNGESWNDEIIQRGTNATTKPNITEPELREFSESIFNDDRYK